MMDSLVRTIGKPAKMIGMISLFLAAAFALIAVAGTLGGGFMPVVGNLILLIFQVALLAVIPLLIVLKKDDMIPYALAPVFSYWIISSIFSLVGDCYLATDNYQGISIAYGVFAFLTGCVLLGVIVLSTLYFITKNKKMLQLAFLVLAGSLFFFLMSWILYLARAAKFDWNWTNYFYAFYNYLFAPIGLTFVVLDFLLSKQKAQPKQEREEAAVQAGAQEQAEKDAFEALDNEADKESKDE